MCAECHQNPCSPQCPNADEPEPEFLCEICSAPVYEGEEYYLINDMSICECCVDDMKRRRENGNIV